MLAGCSVGFFFDIYRSFRCWNKLGYLMTFIGDIFFSLIALVLLLYFFRKANSLAFRFYMLWGSVLGLLIYLRLISQLVQRILLKFYKLVHSFMEGLIFLLRIPFQALTLAMRPPYAVLRWFGLLLYRIGEAILGPPLSRIKNDVIKVVNRLFPPRSNV